MFNIKTMNKISAPGLSRFDAAMYQVSDAVENPDGIVVRSAKLHDYEFPAELRCIARAGAGTNNIPIDRCSEAGIVVFNTPGANANAVKELTLCGLFLASRDIIDGAEWVKSIADQGDAVEKMVEDQKSKFAGQEITGKTLGVIGLGAIGIQVANAATKLGMNVYGYDPFLSVDAAWSMSRSTVRVQDVADIYKNCDYISLHLPSNKDTKGMINADTIATMKDGVRIINLARGELVDDDALLAALESGKVARYVTDFPNGKVAGKAHVIGIPHLGASSSESEDNCAVMAVDQVKDYLENGNIKNSVNFPAVELARSGECRMCVIHRNIPNMLSDIIAKVGAEGLNIENMVNKSKGDYAYTIIDLNSDPAAASVDAIAAIDGVLRIRLIK